MLHNSDKRVSGQRLVRFPQKKNSFSGNANANVTFDYHSTQSYVCVCVSRVASCLLKLPFVTTFYSGSLAGVDLHFSSVCWASVFPVNKKWTQSPWPLPGHAQQFRNIHTPCKSSHTLQKLSRKVVVWFHRNQFCSVWTYFYHNEVMYERPHDRSVVELTLRFDDQYMLYKNCAQQNWTVSQISFLGAKIFCFYLWNMLNYVGETWWKHRTLSIE